MKLLRQELGVVGMEYLLVLGVVVVAMTLSLTGFKVLIPQVVELLCSGVDTAAEAGSSCVVLE